MKITNRKNLPAARRSGPGGAPLLTDEEVAQIDKLLGEGGNPGPDESYDTIRKARRMIQRVQREMTDRGAPPKGMRYGTTVREIGEGQFVGVLRYSETEE